MARGFGLAKASLQPSYPTQMPVRRLRHVRWSSRSITPRFCNRCALNPQPSTLGSPAVPHHTCSHHLGTRVPSCVHALLRAGGLVSFHRPRLCWAPAWRTNIQSQNTLRFPGVDTLALVLDRPKNFCHHLPATSLREAAVNQETLKNRRRLL